MTPLFAVFILVVGIGSTLVLDIWAQVSVRIGWLPGTDWPSVGRWLKGLPQGRLVLDGADTGPFSGAETALGWLFHYLVGIAYAVMFPLFWGLAFIHAPTVWPVVLVGVVISSLAGLMVLMPGLGGGFFARKLPNAVDVSLYVFVSHVIFAVAQYLLAWAVAKML
ncbi:DUF2938 domain-containing protein [Ancylobacter mangrovi]|uniref:DUF2938 domain-containing protein n=1 Tax=Ancylobacter mangrovi TaxID=2972472 RepID=UPI0021639771|nr:DUF2938 domain-containing protein [Ancylobacter mangrovi]MCS0505193.1 DUF2938 domain-containing protein [Ancylobacter mangrovi]